MRGSIRTRYKGSWNIILNLGYKQPQTGQLKRKQKWFTVRGTKRNAERSFWLRLHALHHNALVEPTKLTLGQWLETWLETAIKPPKKRFLTYRSYRSVIHRHLIPVLGALRLQQLQPNDIERYYIETPLAPSSLAQHHAVLSAALKAAQMQGLVHRNVATLVMGKPRHRAKHERAMQACWTAESAGAFVTIVQAEDPQTAAFYSLALDSGARKGELCGLRWEDVNMKAGQLTIVQQLLKGSPPPLFGLPKTSKPQTVCSRRSCRPVHGRQQAEIILANRPLYHDYGLVFARDWAMGCSSQVLGMPLSLNHIGYHRFRRLVNHAGCM